MRASALRFLLPGIGAAEPEAGLQLSPTGGLDMITGDEAVRQAVMLLLATVPGERVMRPDYGCALDRLVFAPNDDTTAGLALHVVAQALARFEPRVDVVSLDAQRPEEDPGRLDIALSYRVRASSIEHEMVVPIRVGGRA